VNLQSRDADGLKLAQREAEAISFHKQVQVGPWPRKATMKQGASRESTDGDDWRHQIAHPPEQLQVSPIRGFVLHWRAIIAFQGASSQDEVTIEPEATA
jgi:hypothetical protein